MKKVNKLSVLILGLSFSFSSLALGVEKKESYYFPYITGNVLGEYNFSKLDSRDDGNKLYDDKDTMSYLQIEGDINIHLFNNFSIKTGTIIRPFMDRMTSINNVDNDYYGKEDYFRRKNYFNKYDLVFEELAFEYKEEEFLFGLGKFNPSFGKAYDKSKYHPIFGTKIAEEYELTEKLGFYVAMTLPMFTLRGNFFYNDDSFLSRSLFDNRGKYKEDNMVGDKRNLENFSVSVDFAVSDYRVNLGIRRMKASDRNGVSEKGYVVGIERLIEESEDSFGFIPFAEYSLIKNYRGNEDRDMHFLTVRLPVVYNNWNLIASYSAKFDKEKHFKDYKSYLAQFGIGYKFNNGIMLDVSKYSEKEAYKVTSTKKTSFKSDAFGVRLSYMINFNED
ncbi:MAG: hypothetical protein IJ853_03400 [Rickettsiales bacterium]|nr:hypothetical protein [Rickettsiales bacterium]